MWAVGTREAVASPLITPPLTAVMQQVEHAVLHDAITDRQAHCRLYFIYADDVSHALPIEHRELVADRGVRA